MKTSTINLSIPQDLLDKADQEAKRESRSRSELMREALRVYLERRDRWTRLLALADVHMMETGLRPEDVTAAVREARKR
jgi:metal-responsive CopG/Arc/MetJ family transcriptional regulator